ELVRRDAAVENALDDRLVAGRQPADASARAIGKVLALVEEHANERVLVGSGAQMARDDLRDALARAAGRLRRLERGLDEAFHAALAYRLERLVLRREVVVEACLPDAQALGDVLRGRAVVAAAGEDFGCGVDGLVDAPPRAAGGA